MSRPDPCRNLTAPRFKPGESGNPGGKPKGARNRLTAAFLNALADDFDAHGVEAIQAARAQNPLGYVKVVGALMPKQVEQTRPLEEVSDAELVAGIALLRTRLAESDGAGTAATDAQSQTH